MTGDERAVVDDDVKEEESGEEEAFDLQLDVEDAGPCHKQVKATVPASVVTGKIEDAYRELTRNAVLPGFRKGRVPRELLERKFGEQIKSEVEQHFLDRVYRRVMEDFGEKLMSMPVLDGSEFGDDNELRVSLGVDLRPELKLDDRYKEMEIEVERVEVDEGAVEERIQALRQRRGRLVEDEEGKVEEGGAVVVDWRLLVDGKVVDEEKERLYPVQKGMIGGVEVDLSSALGGATAGEEREVDVTLPQDFHDGEVAGKQGKLHLAVKSVMKVRLPEVNDDFAKMYGCDTVEALKDAVRKEIEEEVSRINEERVENAIVDELLKMYPMELPERLVKAESERLKDTVRRELGYRGLPPQLIEERVKAVESRAVEEAERRLKRSLVLDEIAAREGMKVEEDDLKDFLKRVGSAGTDEDAAEALDRLSEEDRLEAERIVLRQKVLDMLKEKAKVSSVVAAGRGDAEKTAGDEGAEG